MESKGDKSYDTPVLLPEKKMQGTVHRAGGWTVSLSLGDGAGRPGRPGG